MKWTDKESYSLPVVLAIVLHVVVLGAGGLAVTFSDDDPQPPKRPPIVNAKIVDVSETVIGKREADKKKAAEVAAKAQAEAKRKAQEQARRKAEKAELEKQRKQAEAEKRKQEQVRKKAEDERRAAQAKKKAEQEKARQAKIAKEKKAAQEKAKREREKKAAEAKAKQEAERKRQQELERQRVAEAKRKRQEAEKAKQEAERRKRAEEAVRQAMEEEEARQRAIEEGQMVQSISSLINNRVTAAWIRPPSARNGMKVTLRISFLPNGEVSNAQVLKSSGDPVFDKRAMDAVYKVGRIEELSEVDSYIFERNFRQIDLLFNPQDLRN